MASRYTPPIIPMYSLSILFQASFDCQVKPSIFLLYITFFFDQVRFLAWIIHSLLSLSFVHLAHPIYRTNNAQSNLIYRGVMARIPQNQFGTAETVPLRDALSRMINECYCNLICFIFTRNSKPCFNIIFGEPIIM